MILVCWCLRCSITCCCFFRVALNARHGCSHLLPQCSFTAATNTSPKPRWFVPVSLFRGAATVSWNPSRRDPPPCLTPDTGAIVCPEACWDRAARPRAWHRATPGKSMRTDNCLLIATIPPFFLRPASFVTVAPSTCFSPRAATSCRLPASLLQPVG